jgi:hypothetical protein
MTQYEYLIIVQQNFKYPICLILFFIYGNTTFEASGLEKFTAIATLLVAPVVASVPAHVALCVVGAPSVYGFSAVAVVLALIE